ncbi:Lrp/AsnC ligand binding domain-containing protein [Halorussus lipolyticus]|uniref:Lrp/AsnC ligand binding domain-containing protein n=1 Tax=Halorussus lipolyticus TaxID=3034024 RepID=UPI0023E7AEA1|nr:Lrp/AsnC ligand binding domain-containing protein [Halorussus sp. DT80]
MVRAYTTVITGTGASEDALAAIRELDGVTEAHVVAGDFDIVAEIEAETVRGLQKIVTAGIHEIEDVGTTRTYIQMD